MQLEAVISTTCRTSNGLRNTVSRPRIVFVSPALKVKLFRGARLIQCLGLSEGGDGSGPNDPGRTTAHDDDDDEKPKASRHLSWVLLAFTAAGALCWRDVTKPRSWTAYGSLPGKVSIIIPALNEEKGIAETWRAVLSLQPPPHEVIVVDGGSTDRTQAVVAGLGVCMLTSAAGRARQMNAGAKAATGDLLCFLHSDTQPPHEVVNVIKGVMAQSNTVLGGFRTVIQTDGKRLHGMTFHHLVKTHYVAMLLRPLAFARGIRCLFGDQTLFCRAADFEAVGGFQDDLPIMEDVDLCIRMHEAGSSSQTLNGHASRPHKGRRGRVTMVMNPVNRTSGRRLTDWGAVQATAIHFYIALRWYFGASPQQMYQIYHQMYTDDHR